MFDGFCTCFMDVMSLVSLLLLPFSDCILPGEFSRGVEQEWSLGVFISLDGSAEKAIHMKRKFYL